MAYTDTTTYALARPVPYLLVRGLGSQSLQAPIRHGSGAGLVAPDSGTITITRPDGTEYVSAAAVAVVGSVATYALTAIPDAETLGAGWTVEWDLVIGGSPWPTFRSSAYLMVYVPPCVISEADLYGRIPELRQRVPQSQGERGDDTGWQPQIDIAYWELIRRLLDDGRRPWMIREVTGYHEWLLTRALQVCVGAVSYGPDTSWAARAKDLAFELRRAEGRLRIQYSDDDPEHRRVGEPVTRLAPVGRPRW